MVFGRRLTRLRTDFRHTLTNSGSDSVNLISQNIVNNIVIVRNVRHVNVNTTEEFIFYSIQFISGTHQRNIYNNKKAISTTSTLCAGKWAYRILYSAHERPSPNIKGSEL